MLLRIIVAAFPTCSLSRLEGHSRTLHHTPTHYSLFENKRTIFTHKILAQITESTRKHPPALWSRIKLTKNVTPLCLPRAQSEKT
jgi:hypothetical protein